MSLNQPRSVTYLYGGTALALLLVIATVALVLVPPSAPSVAEFAPRAEDRIEEAPDVQSSRFGSGGEVGVGGLEPTPPAAKAAGTVKTKDIVRARVRRCVGDPPRQTEDPQSPPCVNYWEGDNGGATAPGVTRDEIRVVVPGNGDRYDAMARFFSSRYEFYGRSLRIVEVERTDFGDSPDVARAWVAEAAQRDPFAATSFTGNYIIGDQPAYYDELARRRIIGVEGNSGLNTSDMPRRAPYLWSYLPSIEELLTNEAEFICRSLVGHPARHAGPEFVASTRRFAVVVLEDNPWPRQMETLRAAIERCQGSTVRLVEMSAGDRSTNDAAMLDLRTSGVTSITCPCQMYGPMDAANDVGYQPEWVMGGTHFEEMDYHLTEKSGAASMFGLGAMNKLLPYQDEPTYWALREAAPDQVNPSRPLWLSFWWEPYRSLLVLASGIQMAGPNLTPATFERGLLNSRFPNPGAAGPPYFQATVGFGPDDRSMVADMPLVWVDVSSNEVDRMPLCYIERGARWSSGRWPSGEQPFFDRTKRCR